MSSLRAISTMEHMNSKPTKSAATQKVANGASNTPTYRTKHKITFTSIPSNSKSWALEQA